MSRAPSSEQEDESGQIYTNEQVEKGLSPIGPRGRQEHRIVRGEVPEDTNTIIKDYQKERLAGAEKAKEELREFTDKDIKDLKEIVERNNKVLAELEKFRGKRNTEHDDSCPGFPCWCDKSTQEASMEKWVSKLMDDFCVMFERADRPELPGDEWVARMENFIRELVASTRKATIQESREAVPEEMNLKQYWGTERLKASGYNVFRQETLDALQALEEKI